jgi:ABC-type uncharacterized transport system substrate-binding protein
MIGKKSTNCLVLFTACMIVFGFGTANAAGGKKVLLIDSYHEGYEWSDGIVQGAKTVLGDKYELKVVRMDTKRNGSEDFKKQAGEKVKQEIESWKPDVVIAADDNSAKYVIVPFYKDKEIPFVFCGINWDASEYGFPCSNVTGMLEVSLVTPLVDAMGKFAKGQKVGFLGKDNETDRKEAQEISKRFNLKLTEKFVNTFDEWKTAYAELQGQVDMLLFYNNAGITGWDDAEAKKFVRENTKIPSGATMDHMVPFVLVGYTKLATEQGEWAAGTAIQIMEGKAVKDIPVTTNQKGQLFANMLIAEKLGVTFPLELLKAAKVVKE